MRLDHYLKIGNNNIHMAAILYSLLVIAILVVFLGSVLTRSVKKDLALIELINMRKKENLDSRRNANGNGGQSD